MSIYEGNLFELEEAKIKTGFGGNDGGVNEPPFDEEPPLPNPWELWGPPGNWKKYTLEELQAIYDNQRIMGTPKFYSKINVELVQMDDFEYLVALKERTVRMFVINDPDVIKLSQVAIRFNGNQDNFRQELEKHPQLELDFFIKALQSVFDRMKTFNLQAPEVRLNSNLGVSSDIMHAKFESIWGTVMANKYKEHVLQEALKASREKKEGNNEQ